jgi:hypothetical protein
MVAGVIVSWTDPDFVESAVEVAVRVTFAGRPGATVGAVYVVGLLVVELNEPQGLGVVVHDAELVKLQVTPVLVVLVTVAVRVEV